jgi:anti-sigma-K factor RskA
VERHEIHELSAAYALHALDSDDERVFEDHIAHCDECREQVSSFQETSALLAYDGYAPAPPPPLKTRILAQARADRPNVVPLRRRWILPSAVGFAAAAASAALALGIWAASLSSSLDEERVAHARSQEALNVLARADGRTFPLEGAEGALVRARDGRAWLVVFGLEKAPGDKTYEAWVIEDGEPVPAGLFRGGGLDTLVPLTTRVRTGAVVAVTLERAGGVAQPQSKPLFTSTPAA